MKKHNLLGLLAILSIMLMGVCTWVSPSSGEAIDITDGINLEVDASAGLEFLDNCTITWNHALSVGTAQNVSADNDTVILQWTTTDITYTSRGQLDAFCSNLNGSTETCTLTGISMKDFVTGDLDDVTADFIGTTGIAGKEQMPLFILGGFLLILTGIIIAAKKKW